MKQVLVAGKHLEYVRLPSAHPREGAPAIVFLHEGLGSVSMWRDFPQKVADATGCEAIVYSRAGYGRSDAAELPRTTRYMHDEGLQVLSRLGQQPSDGRSVTSQWDDREEDTWIDRL